MGQMLTHERTHCRTHILPFRAEWPKGFMIMQIKLFQALTAVEGIWDEAKRLAGLPVDAEVGTAKIMNAVLDVKPACCRVSKAKLVELYVDSGIGALGRCHWCNRKRRGTPIITNTQNIKHVCFECIAHAIPGPS